MASSACLCCVTSACTHKGALACCDSTLSALPNLASVTCPTDKPVPIQWSDRQVLWILQAIFIVAGLCRPAMSDVLAGCLYKEPPAAPGHSADVWHEEVLPTLLGFLQKHLEMTTEISQGPTGLPVGAKVRQHRERERGRTPYAACLTCPQLRLSLHMQHQAYVEDMALWLSVS